MSLQGWTRSSYDSAERTCMDLYETSELTRVVRTNAYGLTYAARPNLLCNVLRGHPRDHHLLHVLEQVMQPDPLLHRQLHARTRHLPQARAPPPHPPRSPGAARRRRAGARRPAPPCSSSNGSNGLTSWETQRLLLHP